MNITILQPNYLSFLFVIPIFILIHFISIKLNRRRAIRFANFDAIARIRGIDLYSKNIWILILSSLIAVLMVFSIAGTLLNIEKKTTDFSFVLVIDSSKSMDANDLQPNRIEAAKKAAISFVDSAPIETRIGVESFSGNAIIEQTVSDDKSLVREAISRINITSVGGTDIYEAIITGTNLLVDEKSGSIILLSDGQVNTGSIDDAINYANRYNVVINTIAIGTKEGGSASFGLSKLDEDSLKAISFNTHGSYSNAANENELIDAYSNIMDLKVGPASINISKYLLIAALVIFILEFALINTKYRIFP